jgi:CRISPR-associated protein Csd1
MEQLKNILDFSSNEKIKILFNFLTKENLIKTLIDNNILTLDESEVLDETEIKTIARFKILDKNKEYFLFNEKEIIDLFFKYYNENDEGIVDFDYNTGIKGVCGEKFPSKIRNTGDKAKIFSANDTSGYTFRGQFKNAKEARSINHIISDKAHNALKYLIKKQGFRQDDKVILIFGNVDAFDAEKMIKNDTFAFLGIEEIPKYDSYNEYANFIRKNFLGIKNNLFNEKIPEDLFLNILILDTMVPGRLSINFFKEYRGITELENFIRNIQEWYLSTNWYAYKKISDNEIINYYTNISIFDIVKSIYGFEDQKGDLSFKKDDKIVKKTIVDILKLVINNRKMDYRIVQLLTNKAKNPFSYNNHYNWKKSFKNCLCSKQKIL